MQLTLSCRFWSIDETLPVYYRLISNPAYFIILMKVSDFTLTFHFTIKILLFHGNEIPNLLKIIILKNLKTTITSIKDPKSSQNYK